MKDGGPAFPIVRIYNNGQSDQLTCGMSLRDYFAAEAMQAFISFPGKLQDNGRDVERSHGSISTAAYLMADAMLQAREAKR